MDKKKAVAYIRTKKSRTVDYVQVQSEKIRERVSSMEDIALMDIYADTSGKTAEGVSYKKMIADAYEHKFDLVVVKDFGTFGWDLKRLITIIKQLKENGVSVYSINDNFCTDVESYGIYLSIIYAVRETRRELLAERKARKRQQ